MWVDEEGNEREMMTLRDCYDYVLKVIKEYVDMDEMYHPIVATWLIGTYYHDAMVTYPYLYLNATKSGGKTRFMRLGSFIAKNGDVSITPSSASLFRQAQAGFSFFFDELEQITRKENTNLRLLLNAAYKRGMKVNRAKKVKSETEENYEIQAFEVFTPVAMANIWGLENVLQDRCITVTMDKSTNPAIIKRAEIWELDPNLQKCKQRLAHLSNEFFAINEHEQCSYVDVVPQKNIILSFLLFWNKILQNIHNNNTTYNYITTLQQLNEAVQSVQWIDDEDVELNPEYWELSKKVWMSGIGGRSLELFLPLIMMGHMIDEEVEDAVIKSAKSIVQDREADDAGENRDNMLLAFLLDADRDREYYRVQDITSAFSLTFQQEEWIKAKWVGHALKRLRVIKAKKRKSHGIEVKLDWEKIDQKCHQLGIESEVK